MAIRDTWHRALVYFGLAEDHYDDVEDYYEPETGSEDTFEEAAREPAPTRRGGLRGARARDEIDDIFGDDTPAPAPRRGGRGDRGDGGGGGGGGRARTLEAVDMGADQQMHMVAPRNFNDAQQVADQFKRSVPVIINLQTTDKELAKRLIDFASGLTYALGGGMQRIADKVFLLTPANVDVSADEKARLLERGFFNQS